MTGQDFQDRLDAIVVDLQTKGKGQTIEITLRDNDNSSQVLPLSSTVGGVVDVGQLAAIQTFIDGMKTAADTFGVEAAPVVTARDAFNVERERLDASFVTAKAARDALQATLDADAPFQTAQTALNTAQADADYIAALAVYKDLNVSENYAELQNAKGKYIG